jgi:predicted DNA-binding transcriptional regulator YafY
MTAFSNRACSVFVNVVPSSCAISSRERTSPRATCLRVFSFAVSGSPRHLRHARRTVRQAGGGAGQEGRAQLEAIESCFHSYEKHAYQRSPADVFWPLIDAIAGRHLCEVTYRAPRPGGRRTRFLLLPLRLFAHDGAVYLWAHVPRYDQVITVNLHRLQKLTVQEKKSEPPPGFSPERWESTAFRVFTSMKPPVGSRAQSSSAGVMKHRGRSRGKESMRWPRSSGS